MIPKFSNPHTLTLSEKAVSRSELYESDNETDQNTQLSDDALATLHETLKRNIQYALDIDPSTHDEGRKRKKRKVAQDVFSDMEHEGEGNVVLFRLFSTTSQPELVSLAPLPPPPSIYREPEYEDSPEMAKKRAQFASQAAVDARWMAEQASVRYLDPFSQGSFEKAQSSSTTTAPPHNILLLERPLSTAHKFRCSTRQPSAKHTSALDDDPPPPARVLVLKVTPSPVAIDDQTKAKQKRKRVRAKTKKTDHPPPKYWTPDPAWGGKSLGYAFGYPSHLNNAYSYDYDHGSGGGVVNSKRGWRDTMKKAVASTMSSWP